MRKALFVGINEYAEISHLAGCENDAMKMSAALSRHADGRPNFEGKDLIHREQMPVTKVLLEQEIQTLFSGSADIALLFFAGHGYFDENIDEGVIIPHDYSSHQSNGVRISDIMLWASRATNIKNKIIILDCCQAGAAGQVRNLRGGDSILADGTTILTACQRDEYAQEQDGQGIFTALMLEALYGAGANILGHVTPGSLYSFVDQALGAWEQRPVFKTNVSRFVVLREVGPRIPLETLRQLPDWFASGSAEYPLDPSYEPDSGAPNEDNVRIFRQLQACNRHGLVEPVNAEHMYYAAMNSTACRLTALGAYYRKLAEKRRF
ncbi:caspase family protein [Escherichia coli]|uniref:caspase family protein n=1 Tax=Escherichia coli TaxID=562 RepID=UPI0001F91E47|nr:caspase family protein [Escherichia coli]EFA8284818.1 caspase family protein [Escherichia coli O157]EEW4294480.1 caspase family protein [Escherichia coli]EEZ5826539.1 caspase family protein [Escherichia coli]EFG4662711.1 caspase family protein [Escherichia coli]EFH7028056.1 caspase family protein [Escherichia coli]